MPAIREEVGDDKTTIKCETSTPALPLSLRLGHLHTGALHTATHEDLRDAHKYAACVPVISFRSSAPLVLKELQG